MSGQFFIEMWAICGQFFVYLHVDLREGMPKKTTKIMEILNSKLWQLTNFTSAA